LRSSVISASPTVVTRAGSPLLSITRSLTWDVHGGMGRQVWR
jgi:hypothetical protein